VPATPTSGATNAIDRRGRQIGVTNGTAVTSLILGDAGETLIETNVTGILAGLWLTNHYDNLLRRTNLTLLNQQSTLSTINFGFDAASRLSTVSDGTNNATYSYPANSPLVSQITFRSNTVTRMTTSKQYDFLNRLTAISNLPSGAGQPATSFNCSYNSANQRVQVNLGDGRTLPMA
jgi:hypothetical protein